MCLISGVPTLFIFSMFTVCIPSVILTPARSCLKAFYRQYFLSLQYDLERALFSANER